MDFIFLFFLLFCIDLLCISSLFYFLTKNYSIKLIRRRFSIQLVNDETRSAAIALNRNVDQLISLLQKEELLNDELLVKINTFKQILKDLKRSFAPILNQ
jgi:hypothetical protein